MRYFLYFFILLLLITGATHAQMIGTGLSEHSIAVKSDGTVYTWGLNWYGQLGDNSNSSSNFPVAVYKGGVLSGKTITQVAAGLYHSIALASDGTVYTWVKNGSGQLGNNSTTDSNVPVAVYSSGVLSGKTITQVAAGQYHSIALASDGTVYTWGFNWYGQLGDNSNSSSNVPVAVYTGGVLSGKTITQVAAGSAHCIALASDGTVYTWGMNTFGQLGNNSNTHSNVPVAVYKGGVLSGKSITQVAAGGDHCIALASDGTVYTWGYNSPGQLGNNSNTSSNVPVAVYTSGVLSGKTITQVAAGENHSIALASDGTVYTWGENYSGQLGNNSNAYSNVPVAVYLGGVLSGKNITQVAAGKQHSIALASDGTLYTWGSNVYGQLGNNSNTGSNVPVAVDQSGMGLLTVEDEYSLKEVPTTFSVKQNFPNPFNPVTVIKFSITNSDIVKIIVYDVLGKEIQTLLNEYKETGTYEVEFNASNLPSGVYFYRMQAGNFIETKKMVLMK